MSSRKRKQGDYEDLPPAKTPKHGFGEQPNLNEAATEGPGGTDDAILRFQNHQLFIRLKTQRRRIRELERNEDRVVARKERLDTELSLLRRVWTRLDEDLRQTALRLAVDLPPAPSAEGVGAVLAELAQDLPETDTYEDKLAARVEFSNHVLAAVVDSVVAARTDRQAVVNALQGAGDGVEAQLRADYEAMTARLAAQETAADRLQVAHRELAAQAELAEEKTAAAEAAAADARRRLVDVTEAAETHLRTIDRLQMQREQLQRQLDEAIAGGGGAGSAADGETGAAVSDASAAVPAGGDGTGATSNADASAAPTMILPKKMRAAAAAAAKSRSSTSNGGSGGSSANVTAAAAAAASAAEIEALKNEMENVKTEMEVYRELAATRLQEIDQLTAEGQATAARVRSFELDRAAGVSDDIVRKSRLFYTTYSKIERLEAERDEARRDLERMAAEAHALSRGESERVAAARAAEEGHRTALQSELSQVEAMMKRYKSERDTYAYKLQKLAAVPDLSVTLDEAQKLLTAVQAENTQLREDVKMLRAKATGELGAAGSAAAEDFAAGADGMDADALRARLGEAAAAVSRQAGALAELTAERDALYSEMEVISGAFTDIQEQSTRVVGQLREKEGAHIKMMSNVIKANQARDLIRAEKEALAAKAGAADALVASQKEALSALERQVKELQEAATVQQSASFAQEKALRTAEAQLAARNEEAEKLVLELRDMESQKNSMRAEAEASAGEVLNLQAAVQRAREDVRKGARKLERLQKRLGKKKKGKGRDDDIDDDDIDALLAEEIKRLKGRIKCSICKTRERDVAISKCGHTFCGQCIHKNLKARNRNCPGCQKSYGKTDLVTVYM